MPFTAGRTAKAGKVSCETCEFIVAEAQKFAENKTRINDTIAALDGNCKKLYPNDTKKEQDCESVAKDLVDILPFLDKQMQTLAWDEPLAFCAVFLDVCRIPCCSTHTTPEQLHLAFTGDLSSMSVMWTTLNHTATSTVQWGTAGGPLASSSTGLNWTYWEGGWVGVLHAAVMTGLQPNTTYAYRVGDAQGGWSEEFQFATLPANVGTDARPLRIVQVGDMGYGPHSDVNIQTMSALVASKQVDFVLHVGDVSYADGYMKHWDDFFRKIEPIAARVPYMVTPGNHELWFNFTAYKRRFFMPQAEANKNLFHSFEVGPVHFSMIDTETPIDTANIDEVQMRWIKGDLAAANEHRAQVPWLLVCGHRPFYCTNHHGGGKDCGDFASWLRTLAEDLLHKSKVDLVITAHMHGMERTFPVFKGQPTQTDFNHPTAPVYVVNGAGGNREGNDKPDADKPWSVKTSSSEVGHAIMTFAGLQLKWEFYAANSTLLDSFVLTKA